MKKILLVAIAGGVFLTGCQSTGTASSTPANFEEMTCENIKSTLDTHKETLDHIDTGGSLLSMVGMDSGTAKAKEVAMRTYNASLKAAKPIAKMKNCDFVL